MERYRIRSPQIVYQTIDEEAVVLNLERGHYYSLRSTAEAIWSGIGKGLSASDIVSELKRRYNAGSGEIESAAANFIQKLKEEELVVSVEGSGHEKQAEPSLATEAVQKTAFETPVLEKFTDMEELLLLDPIHEVDEAGWPNAKQPQRNKI